jgi:galactose oxidase
MSLRKHHGVRRLIFGAFALLCLLAVLATSGVRRAVAVGKAGARVQSQILSVADGGSWSGLVPTQDVPVHISLLPDGRLLYWGRDKAADNWDIDGQTKTYLLDPLYPEPNLTATPTPTPGANLFCSGHSFLPDGRLLVSGGHHRPDQYPWGEGVGEPALNVFDYRTNTWTRLATDMPHGRWYPYNVTLGSGETLVMSGRWWNGVSTAMIGGRVTPSTTSNDYPDVRDLSGGLRALTDNLTGIFPVVPNYPYISLTSSGKVFIATPSSIPGHGETDNNSRLLDPYATNSGGGQGVFTAVAIPSFAHLEGTSVMYAPDKVLMVGGKEPTVGDPASNKGERIDLSAAAPTWVSAGQMAWARHYPTATLLPDGKVLVTGGASCPGTNNVSCGGAVQTPEMWDPSNPMIWTQMNPTTSGVPRVYHSVAMLMPDARVLVGAGGLPLAEGETGTDGLPCPQSEPNFGCRLGGHKNVEYFSPPYLYNSDGSAATRPAIVSAPDSIAYGQQFLIDVGNLPPSSIKNVVLIRLPSVTHTYDQDQRRVDLGAPVASDSQYVRMQAPANGNVCPPGPYMMFLISNNGRNTPSVAKIIRVGDLAINRVFPNNGSGQSFQSAPPTASPTPTPLNGSITVSAAPGVNWTATSNSPSWLTVTSGGSGAGNGTVNFTLSNNTGANFRVGAITVKAPGRDGTPLQFKVYQAVNFTDVPLDNPFNKFVSALYARGITAGCGGNNYCPDNPISRGGAAVFLSVILTPPSVTIPDVPPGTEGYTDIPATNIYRKFIANIKRRGIPDGCGGTNYCPDSDMTRKDMVVWIMRALGITNPPPPMAQQFNDVPLSDPAAPFIAEAVRRGLTTGCGGGKFCPTQSVNRNTIAVFLAQAFGL